MTAATPRTRAAGAPSRPGYLTEAELAARWGRQPATLLNWRLRPHAGHTPVPHEILDGWLYYSHDAISAYEADPANARVRPLALRDLPLPSLHPKLVDVGPEFIRNVSRQNVHPELPLSFGEPGQVEFVPDRGFRSIHQMNDGIVAIANDGTAWVATADTTGALAGYTQWRQVTPFPAATPAALRRVG